MDAPTTIRFTVHGLARPAGSKKAFAFKRRDGSLGANVTDDNPKSRGWKQTIAGYARDAYRGPLLDGPLLFIVRFVMPRPKGHSGKRGLKPSAPQYHTVKPDALKLTRAAEDALTGILWRDDAQICRELILKDYGASAWVEIEVRTLGAVEPTVEDLLPLFGDAR